MHISTCTCTCMRCQRGQHVHPVSLGTHESFMYLDVNHMLSKYIVYQAASMSGWHAEVCTQACCWPRCFDTSCQTPLFPPVVLSFLEHPTRWTCWQKCVMPASLAVSSCLQSRVAASDVTSCWLPHVGQLRDPSCVCMYRVAHF